VNEDKDRRFVEEIIRTSTWWKLKTMVEEKLMGADYEGERTKEWKTDAYS